MNSNNFNNTLFNYPKEHSDISSNIRLPNNNISQYTKNPLINKFNYDSFFIFDQSDNIKYYNNLSNKNLIKLNEDEISFLKSIVETINISQNLDKGNELIEIDSEMAGKLKQFFNCKINLSPLAKYIQNKMNSSLNRANISCRKLSNEYLRDSGIKVSKSKIHNVIKNELGYRYLKTILKNNSLNKQSGILNCLSFIKIMTRCLKYEFSPIFVDESKIETSNNHFRAWRYPKEEFLFSGSQKKKCNLLLAVGIDSIIHYKIVDENTNSYIFLGFIKEIKEILDKNNNNKYVLIMDNLKSHKTDEVIKFLSESKLNTIFNAPYCSMFNAVELAFRAIKKFTYSHVYENIEDAKNDVKKLLDSENINKTLYYNYKETIEKYLLYSNDKKVINLNNLDIQQIY